MLPLLKDLDHKACCAFVEPNEKLEMGQVGEIFVKPSLLSFEHFLYNENWKRKKKKREVYDNSNHFNGHNKLEIILRNITGCGGANLSRVEEQQESYLCLLAYSQYVRLHTLQVDCSIVDPERELKNKTKKKKPKRCINK